MLYGLVRQLRWLIPGFHRLNSTSRIGCRGHGRLQLVAEDIRTCVPTMLLRAGIGIIAIQAIMFSGVPPRLCRKNADHFVIPASLVATLTIIMV